jgi:hypothetical protein
MKPTIVFVVGHERWGKSHTLRFLTNGEWHRRYVQIKDTEFYIRRMSNDDKPESYVKFMEALSPQKRAFLIAALCPNFDRASAKTASILKSLKAKGYKLFFWVIQNQYGTNKKVKPEEISKLGAYGAVEVFSKSAEAKQRAGALRSYIETNVIA